MSVEEGGGSSSGVLDLKGFRLDAINTRTRLRDELIQSLLKEWPSIFWTLFMLLIGVVGVGGFITIIVLRGGNSSLFEYILVSFSFALGSSCLLSVFIRYTKIGLQSIRYPPHLSFHLLICPPPSAIFKYRTSEN